MQWGDLIKNVFLPGEKDKGCLDNGLLSFSLSEY